MRIGELAALAGVSTRTVRHYHRIGLLPEPARRTNGYRTYGLRDAVRLVRVRRLTELGLTLDEVADVLADDAGRELREVLDELDADLAGQERALREQRARLAELRDQLPTGADDAGRADGPVSPELAGLLREMARTSAARGGPEPDMAVRERELMVLLDGAAAPDSRGWLPSMVDALGSDPEALARAYDLYARMDELADAPVDDPRVEVLAREVVAALPEDVAREVGQEMASAGPGVLDRRTGDGFARALFAAYTPAQAEVLARAIGLLAERAEGAR
ncbi:MerR family transcriptional regulator [Streptomyces sp. JJ66]|uniref:MerR family transcriptional regulator n=1 Tax=Streptomyces sp. JJ66 TaxID=2803843 RepID=UPI001C55B05E|nr:MerR family transcriptional regulator [Streptomyces sp. JJ66]MBW1604205.1 MerR family transcriptional regulator [Streptomyces sp. JJ66]